MMLRICFAYQWIYFYQRNAKKNKSSWRVPRPLPSDNTSLRTGGCLVPTAFRDNSTHSTLVESAISPLPTFTDISLSDRLSFCFDASKGEAILLRFVFANTLFASACKALLTLCDGWRFSALHSTLFFFLSINKWQKVLFALFF